MRYERLLIALSLLAFPFFLRAQTTTYDPRLTFAPLSLPDPVNVYRSSNGAPGPSYWQNEADYEMRASLDTAPASMTGMPWATGARLSRPPVLTATLSRGFRPRSLRHGALRPAPANRRRPQRA